MPKTVEETVATLSIFDLDKLNWHLSMGLSEL